MSGRNASTAMSSARVWQHPLLDAVLPKGLPGGALTLVTLGDGESRGHWPTAVASLVEATTRARRPVLYVEVAGPQCRQEVALLQERADAPYLVVDHDEDLLVQVPLALSIPRMIGNSLLSPALGVGGSGGYHCGIPTLLTIEPTLRRHERKFGPALVVLNDVAVARPYSDLLLKVADLTAVPGGLGSGPEVVSGWLAMDLLGFAEQREAPTVAVWLEDGGPLSFEPLRDAALVHLQCTQPDEQQPVQLTCRTQAGPFRGWRAPVTVQATAWPL